MAARVFMRQSAVAPLAASTLLAGFALRPETAYAETSQELVSSRKPIYDDASVPAIAAATSKPAAVAPTTATPTKSFFSSSSSETSRANRPARGPSPTDRLAVQIGKVRLLLHGYVVSAEDAVNNTMAKAFSLEQSFTGTIASLAPAKETGEKILPGAVYVLVAAMSGSIVARNRNIVLRTLAPLALGIGASWTFLPVTSRNVSDLAWKYEQRFPGVAESHIKMRESILRGIHFAKVHKQVGLQYVDDTVTSVRESVEDWVKQGK
ncbi:apolipoprotein O [Ceratocystis lukuohia]|uniref:MICOS complex subunit n=1 Tax=Ceratocystis lukuohia TaxID=2019550 RepID=A0ABR4MLY5_9PEZI